VDGKKKEKKRELRGVGACSYRPSNPFTKDINFPIKAIQSRFVKYVNSKFTMDSCNSLFRQFPRFYPEDIL